MAVATSQTRLRILVVEGDRAVLTILRHGLEGAGAEVVSAGDGTSALRQLVDHLLGLDLLVTGLELPSLDGRALVRIVRAEGGETELPIMVLAGKVSGRDRELLSTLGVTEIVEKRHGSDHAVRRAVALAEAARERRLGPPGPALTPIPVAIARLATVRGPAHR